MVGFNYGRFCTSYRGLLRIYQGQGHVKKKKNLFLGGIERWMLSPYLFGAPSIPLERARGGGWYKNVSAALRVSPTHK